jgi:predicted O-methyltransferase YrrM
MEHFYQNIDGWFTFPNLYTEFVNTMKNGARIAEIGVWKGRSLCYLGVLIKNSGKDITAYAIDTWKKMETEDYHNDLQFEDDALYSEFLKTIEPINDVVIPIRKTSLDACKTFPNSHFDVVFIDACHDYTCIKNDILNWLPKVKAGGIIAGHDIVFPGVSQAVNETFTLDKINTQEMSWWVQL